MFKLITILLSLTLIGCASYPQGTLPVSTNGDDNGVIIVFRNQPLQALPINADVIIDDTQVASLTNKDAKRLTVKAGEHTYVFHNDGIINAKAKLTVEPNKITYLRVIYNAAFTSTVQLDEESYYKCIEDSLCTMNTIKPIKL